MTDTSVNGDGILEEEYEGSNTSIKRELSDVQEISMVGEHLMNSLPSEYKVNTDAETRALELAENFRQQYAHLYPTRTPLLLAPLNEADVEKVICTYVKPSLLEYSGFYDWATIADFIKDFLTMRLLEKPTELPITISSPQTVIQNQVANCFEYTNVLVSLLIGAGYDANVVSGYATREVCNADESHDDCPPEPEPPAVEPPKPKPPRKYQVKGAKDLTSKFEAAMLIREKQEKERLAKEEKEKLLQEQNLLEKPLEDDLFGRRIHSWVLVRAGKREVSNDFFIEPFTGVAVSVTDDRFLGVESVWNGKNYYVCIQDNSNGCKNINWDLKDQAIWEPLVARGRGQEHIEEEEDDDETTEEKNIEPDIPHSMPPSWCSDIIIDPEQFESRSPNGRKVILYKRAKIELFAPHVNSNGLVNRTTNYTDLCWTKIIDERSVYKSREDMLSQRYSNNETKIVVDKFKSGRPNCLQEHVYSMENKYIPEVDRTMYFYKNARPDGLIKLIETPSSITLHYCNRDDKLIFREVKFDEPTRRLQPASGQEKVRRKIKEIVENFDRQPTTKNADEDIQEQKFLILQEKINIIYHKKGGFITSSTRNFDKPDNADDKMWNVSFSPDMTSSFTAFNGIGDPMVESDKQLPVYTNLVKSLKAENYAIKAIRAVEDEIRDDLMLRQSEEKNCKLDISVHDVFRNENARIRRDYLREQAEIEEKRQQETDMDYLAPFLAQIASKLQKECLEDLKNRLIEQANLIQGRFDSETAVLRERQQEYQQRQVSMTKGDEEAYRSWCADSMFRIQILEMRLNRHKLMAPQKYGQLDQQLKNDPRLRVI